MSNSKVAIVTGAGSGMGAATARRLANDGFRVVLNGRTADKLQSVADALNGTESLIVTGDVSQYEDLEKLVSETVRQFGQIDVVVNNAGTFVGGTIDDVTPEDFDKQFAVNVKGPFMLIKLALPYLEKTRGAIVNVSSVSGLGGDWGAFAYNASKGALGQMTKALALDFGPKGIRINAVAPSLTDTEMAEGIMSNDEVLDAFKSRIAMERAAKPEEVADVIAFLASSNAQFVTGTIIPVDGGLSASNGQPKMR